jgi:formyl-CoA transferase
MLANQASNALVGGSDPVRQGAGHPNIVPYQPFQAADQPIIVAVGNDRQFARFAAILGHSEWKEDPAFATNAARVAARDRLVPMIAAIIATRSAAEWQAQLETAGVPSGPINTISQALADVQAVHRGALLERSGGALGDIPMVGSPVRFDGQRSDAELPPPALGEHNDEVLGKFMDRDEIERLKAAGIVG